MPEKRTVESKTQVHHSSLMAGRIAFLAGLFLPAVVLVLLWNVHVLRRNDPLLSPAAARLAELADKCRIDSADKASRDEARILDHRMRRNYFDAMARLRYGGMLLVAGAALLVMSLNRSFEPVPAPGPEPMRRNVAYARMVLALLAASVLIVAIVLALMWKT